TSSSFHGGVRPSTCHRSCGTPLALRVAHEECQYRAWCSGRSPRRPAGGGAMSLAHRLLAEPSPEAQAAKSAGPEDPTIKVAGAAARLAGYRLQKEHKASAGSIVHYAFGAVVGALYGAAAEIAPRATAALGL